MKLVGGQQLNGAPGDYSLTAHLFDRLPKEMGNAGGVLRYVGYDSRQKNGNNARFLGVVVPSFDHIPHGMIGWELADTNWTVCRAEDDRPAAAWQEDIQWLWRSGHDDDAIGEFRADGPHDWGRSGDLREVLLVTTAYFPADGSGPPDDVQIVDYDKSWPEQYSEMAGWLQRELGPTIALCVEHYGSTAMPGMPAKPVIDILVEVPSFQAAKKRGIPLLNSLEWEYWWHSEHMVFIKRQGFMGHRTHHIHMAPRGHAIWNGLAFRDYLRTHPEDAKRYADLKRHLASAHRGDRETYTDEKKVFVTEITAKAMTPGQ